MMLFIFLLFLTSSFSSSWGLVTWIPDKVSVLVKPSTKGSITRINITAQANGKLFHNVLDEGHFQIQYMFLYKNTLPFQGQTKCISFTGSAAQAEVKLLESFLSASSQSISGQQFSSYYNVLVQKYYNDFSSTTQTSTSLLFSVVPVSQNVSGLNFQVSLEPCQDIKTIGSWGDKKKWMEGRVPNSSDDVAIPFGSGVIQFSSDVFIRSLNISSGIILALQSNCLGGWIADNRGAYSDKCFRLVDEPLSFSDASSFCKRSVGAGSIQRNLVKISDRRNLDLVYRLCRTRSGKGCWIGLSDSLGTGNFRWLIDDGQQDSNMFLDWRRAEPNNHTMVEGKESAGGERCVSIMSWKSDPLVEEQGGWNDLNCENQLPFVCQSSATTMRLTLSLFNLNSFGGIFDGGIIALKNSSRIDYLKLSNGARLDVQQNASAVVKSLQLEGGAKVHVDGSFILNDGVLGEKISTFAQSVIDASATSRIYVRGNVSINARLSSAGHIVINHNSRLQVNQGGLLSQASLTALGTESSLVLAGYASRLATYDAFELKLANRGPFVGEFNGKNEFGIAPTKGVYRLRVQSASSSFYTRCIPFNASAESLTAALNEIPLVQNRGGVTVRRFGDATNKIYSFGFTYRIEMDAPQTYAFNSGTLSLSLHCQGLDCGCAESKVSIFSPTGQSQCPNPSNYSIIDDKSCVLRSTISVERLSALSFLQTLGLGRIEVLSGVHRLMPLSNLAVSVQDGLAVVAADVVTWLSVSVSRTGVLRLAGTGWGGWDSQDFLYRPSWEDHRGLFALNQAPPTNMTCQSFSLSDDAQFLCAGVGSRLRWSRGIWRGGVLGGLCDAFVEEHIDLAGNIKELRYGMALHVQDKAQAVWTEGNISLANGARMFIDGLLNISNANRPAVVIGEAHLLTSAQSQVEGGRSWQSYFDSTLLSELRPAWYSNPLCGDRCFNVNELMIEGSGLLLSDANSSSVFLLPVKIEGMSRFDVGENAKVNLGSGGVFGNDVIVDLSRGTLLELSGGEMFMEAQCTIRGVGELVVSAGSHAMGFSIDAHITISGGTLLWPESRGTQKTITFNGGLLIRGTGQLQVQPFSTTILVHKEVHLTEQSQIQFPLIGIAAQASPFDRNDAPDSSPRGNLTSTGTMRWEGGTLLGKADFYALHELFLDGDIKFIKSLAKLVNKGHCEWGEGNIVSSDNGDFQNFGTIQMKNGVSNFFSEAMYKGSELPVDNGGDFFALQYHSWDADYGSLDYSEYLLLRTRFVSKVPAGLSFSNLK